MIELKIRDFLIPINKLNFITRKHSSTCMMRTDQAVTRMSSDRVAMRPIVSRMTDRYL